MAGILVLTLVSCTLLGTDDPHWDTDIPDGAPVEAKLATWHPSGDRIAFVHSPDSLDPGTPGAREQLWTYHLQTQTMQRVLGGPVNTPHWHPDGSRLVFHSGRFPQHLFTVGVDGTGLRRLTGTGSPNPDLQYAVVGRWRPSGDRLLFGIGAGDNSGIYTMQPSGQDVRKHLSWSVMASWFPDGERIVYASWDPNIDDDRNRKQIYVADADGTNPRRITDLEHTADLAWPVVSPSGETIVFAYQKQLYLVDADGDDVRRITGGEGRADRPAWSPTGRQILFHRTHVREGRSVYRLFLLDVESLEVEPVFPTEES